MGIPLLVFANKQDLIHALSPAVVTDFDYSDHRKAEAPRYQNQEMDYHGMLGQGGKWARRWTDLAHRKRQQMMNRVFSQMSKDK